MGGGVVHRPRGVVRRTAGGLDLQAPQQPGIAHRPAPGPVAGGGSDDLGRGLLKAR